MGDFAADAPSAAAGVLGAGADAGDPATAALTAFAGATTLALVSFPAACEHETGLKCSTRFLRAFYKIPNNSLRSAPEKYDRLCHSSGADLILACPLLHTRLSETEQWNPENPRGF